MPKYLKPIINWFHSDVMEDLNYYYPCDFITKSENITHTKTRIWE